MQARSARKITACLADSQDRPTHPLPDLCFSKRLASPTLGSSQTRPLVAQSPPARNSWLFCSVSFGGPNFLERARALLLFCCCFVNTRINFLFFLLTRAYVISVLPTFVQQLVKRRRFSAKFYPFSIHAGGGRPGRRAVLVADTSLFTRGLFVFCVITGLLWLFNLLRDFICGRSFARRGCR